MDPAGFAFTAPTSKSLQTAMILADLKMMESSKGLQVPECPVCWEDFNEHPHLPRLLGCGHTICEPCIGHLPIWKSLTGNTSVTCPECRSHVIWRGLHKLPKNYALLRMLVEAAPYLQTRGGSSSSSSSPSAAGGGGKRARRRARGDSPLALYVQQLCLPPMLDRVAGLATNVSVLLGILVGLCVFLPLCFTYVMIGWWIALLTCVAFCWLTMAAVGFGVAGLLSFLCVNWMYFLKVRAA
eukprot:jgi/Mesen1/3582/ME000020S03107